MIRRSPAETYIKYLILHPRQYTNAQIREILEYAQLDFLGDWYVDRLRAQLDPPEPFYPFDVSHKASRLFLLSTGLTWIFCPDLAGRKAFKMLELPRVKEFVESMITVGAPSIAIASAVSNQRGFSCTSSTIDRYKEFFWNVDLLDSTELRALLQLRVDGLAGHGNPQIAAQHGAMKRAFYNDARRTAAELPFSPLSALVAQMRMGLMPSKLDLAKVMEQSRHFVAVRIYEAASNNGKGDSSKAFDYATVLEKLTNVLEKVVKPDEELRNELAQIALRTEESPIPAIHALSGGNHTVDVAPVQEKNDELSVGDDDDSGDESS